MNHVILCSRIVGRKFGKLTLFEYFAKGLDNEQISQKVIGTNLDGFSLVITYYSLNLPNFPPSNCPTIQ